MVLGLLANYLAGLPCTTCGEDRNKCHHYWGTR